MGSESFGQMFQKFLSPFKEQSNTVQSEEGNLLESLQRELQDTKDAFHSELQIRDERIKELETSLAKLEANAESMPRQSDSRFDDIQVSLKRQEQKISELKSQSDALDLEHTLERYNKKLSEFQLRLHLLEDDSKAKTLDEDVAELQALLKQLEDKHMEQTALNDQAISHVQMRMDEFDYDNQLEAHEQEISDLRISLNSFSNRDCIALHAEHLSEMQSKMNLFEDILKQFQDISSARYSELRSKISLLQRQSSQCQHWNGVSQRRYAQDLSVGERSDVRKSILKASPPKDDPPYLYKDEPPHSY